MGIPSMSLQAVLEVCIREVPPSVIRHLRLSYPSLLDPADNIRDEVSSRFQYKKSLVVAIGFQKYQQFSCQVREPIFPLCVLARH